MSNLNKVMLVGRLGADPEVRYTADNTAVTTFNMATSESFKDRMGEWQEKTEWHTVKAWRYLAEKAAKLKKGNLVYVEGKIQSREYEGRDGVKRKLIDIVASDVKPLFTGTQNQEQGERRDYNPQKETVEDDFVPEDDVPM